MSLRKQVLDSKEQLVFDLLEEELSVFDDYYSDEDEEFLSLLEEILSEVFSVEPDKESLEHLSGNAIYDLADEREIVNRERYEAQYLDEGSPCLEDLEALEQHAQEYFKNPKYYPLDEDDTKRTDLTGFLQIYTGEKFDTFGNRSESWKSINKKVIIKTSDLMDPQKIIGIIEQQGIKFSSIFRCIFYGHSLVELIGSRFYSDKEPKEFLPLSEEYNNILLALPDYVETEQNSPSTFDWIEEQVQNGILLGTLPDLHRSSFSHWELTHARLLEIAEEELENKSLIQFTKKESSYVSKQNVFIEKYSEARNLISSLNGSNPDLSLLYTKDTSVLEEVIFLCTKCNERINDSFVYLQIKSLVAKLKILQLQESDSSALRIIQKINQNEHVDIHLIGLVELTNIMEILWSNCGIRITEVNKQVYFDLKERLSLLRRSAKLRFVSK